MAGLGSRLNIQLEFTDATESLLQAAHKAPVGALGLGVRYSKRGHYSSISIGEIPEILTMFKFCSGVQAVLVGDLELFRNVADKFASTFSSDSTLNLVVRLRYNGIRTGTRYTCFSYPRISLVDVAHKPRLDSPNPVADAESNVAKAFRDNEAVPALGLSPNSHIRRKVQQREGGEQHEQQTYFRG
ncbi:hypothetical protein C5167_011907 [Papaver somniferum]|uniref:Uncharacterized protein n=1 Tax=Papaver somniferum TaxID=3469 RepID=A0A4Y7J058_PAPSO|nr:hypothetical protein C5167_011907 [Papaver somniferum]